MVQINKYHQISSDSDDVFITHKKVLPIGSSESDGFQTTSTSEIDQDISHEISHVTIDGCKPKR